MDDIDQNGQKMSEKSGIQNNHEVNCACTACMPDIKTTYDWDNPHKVNHSNNWILNKIGNLCGIIGELINRPYYKWGTFWTIDMVEDIDKEDE